MSFFLFIKETPVKNVLKNIVIGMGLLGVLTPTANAQWVQTNGPGGGCIACLAVSGSKIFAGADGGLYLSSNNGVSWTAVNSERCTPRNSQNELCLNFCLPSPMRNRFKLPQCNFQKQTYSRIQRFSTRSVVKNILKIY